MKIINDHLIYDVKEHVIRRIISEKIEVNKTQNFIDRIEVPEGYNMYEMNILDSKLNENYVDLKIMVTFINNEPVICSKYQNSNYPGRVKQKERKLRRWKNY